MPTETSRFSRAPAVALVAALMLGSSASAEEGVEARDQAAEPESSERRWELMLSPEVTAVGLSFGLRPELVYRPFERGTASRLTASLGLLWGPEFLYVPVSVGYRAVYRSEKTVRPVLGVGLELQQRIVGDAPWAEQLGLYLEGGVLVGLNERASVGLLLRPDVMFVGLAGAGLSARLALGWAL